MMLRTVPDELKVALVEIELQAFPEQESALAIAPAVKALKSIAPSVSSNWFAILGCRLWAGLLGRTL